MALTRPCASLTCAVRALTPPFGQYTALSAQLSGNLRHTHSRLAEFAEEIAFFGGEGAEKMLVEREYAGLVKHENRVLRRRWWHGCVEEGIVKWLWGSFGVRWFSATTPRYSGDADPPPFVSCASALFRCSSSCRGLRHSIWAGAQKVKPHIYTTTHTTSHVAIGFVTNRRLLLSASDAFGRVMYSYKDLSELAGYTTRVALLLETMEDVRKGKFDKALVSSASIEENAKSSYSLVLAIRVGINLPHSSFEGSWGCSPVGRDSVRECPHRDPQRRHPRQELELLR